MARSAVSPVLVGRAAEAAALRAAYLRAREGHSGTVLVSGEAGIGKSRLVAAATRSLPADPLLLSGWCLELGSAGAPYVPFVAILRDLVRGVGRDRVAAMLPADGCALGDWLPDLGPAPARYTRTRQLEEMLSLVSRVSRDQPVVLVVEDLHWADASSRELFAYLARNLAAGDAALLIGTLRTGELAAGHPNRRLLAELGRRPDVERIDLGPLARDEVVELLTAIDERPPEAGRGERIHRRSGGNPLFVEALSDAGQAAGDDVQALLRDRITSLPEPCREVLAALAVAGAGLADEVLAEVGELRGERLDAALADLIGRDLVVAGADGYAIRHDLIRAAVYDSVLPGRRRRLHARCAAALAERGRADAAVAEHWVAAEEVARALPVAWQATQVAARQHAHDERQHLLELILARWNEVEQPSKLLGADRVAVLEQAAAAAFATGRSAAGIAHSTDALSVLDPVRDPHKVAVLLSLRGQLHNRVDGAGQDDLERAVELVPPGADDELRSRLLSVLAFIDIPAHRYEDSRRHAAEALQLAESGDDDALKAPALLALAAVDSFEGELEQALRRFAAARKLAEAVGDEHTFLTTFQWEASLLADAGHYEQAAELARIGALAAERLGRARSRGSMLAVVRAIPLRHLGRWDEADQLAQEALADNPPPLYTAYLRAHCAEIARCRGQAERAELLLRQVAEFARHAPGADEAILVFATECIASELEQGEPERADRILGEYLAPAGSVSQPHAALRLAVFGARVQRARRAAAPRNRRLAEQIGERLTQLARLVDAVAGDNPAATAYRLSFQAEISPDELSGWDRAAAAWRDLGNRYETALALTEGATAALASNNRPGARSRLREARTLAAELGAEPLLARIDGLTARGRLAEDTGAAPRNEFGLTPRELDVLRKLAAGSSNPQIAAELFISTNTVATHVARILSKLGASTRTQAADRARRSGLLGTLDDAPPEHDGRAIADSV